jgi:hypothetical protein
LFPPRRLDPHYQTNGHVMLCIPGTLDHYFLQTVQEWGSAAISIVDELESWRGDPDEHGARLEGLAFLFAIRSGELIREARDRDLDLEPIRELCAVVDHWDRTRDVDQLPDPRRLRRMLTAASVTIEAIEDAIDQGRPIPASITPFASDGRRHESNGAHPNGRMRPSNGAQLIPLVAPDLVQPDAPKEARDQFLYERLLSGEPQSKVLRACNALAAERKWNRLQNTNSAVDAANHWALAHGKPQLPKRKPGRRGGPQY